MQVRWMLDDFLRIYIYHVEQVRVAQLCGSELDGLTVSQLEELERMQAEALRRCGVAKYVRLRQEFQEKEEHMREDVEKMRREFEERMDKMKGEVQKIQEEKVCLYVVCECACACACTCMYYLSHVRSLALSYHTIT